jgi:large subunit ribosomal protein L33
MGKGKEHFVAMQCADCGNLNYRTRHKRKAGAAEKLALKKFCPFCRAHKEHKEKRS